MESNPKIVVLGAGFAGIGAATKLVSLGFKDVTILEASGEAGGRVANVSFGQAKVDIGAQFIHGASKVNPVYNLMKQHGLLTDLVSKKGNDLIFHSKGHKVTGLFAGLVFVAGGRIIEKKHKGNLGKNLGDHFAERSEALVNKWWLSDEAKMNALNTLTVAGRFALTALGAPALNSVALNCYEYFINMGEDLDMEGNMFSLITKLLEDFPKDRLLLDRPVTQISWDGGFCDDEKRLYPVNIECENGEKILCDHVVVTFSLGCLKAAPATMFDPQLPDDKREAIEKLGFGCVAKIFLLYEEAFWERDAQSIILMWDDETPASLSDASPQWQKNIQLFTVMRPREKFGDVLIGWCCNRVAQQIQNLTEAELSDALTSNFRRFMGVPSIPCPKTIMRTQWQSKPFVRGGYSYVPPGVDAAIMDQLAAPLSSRKRPTEDLQVLFAGEATIKTQYSTVQGALMSGHREAERLARHYGKPVPDDESSTSCSLQ
ncbi:peroxisomal N(1)-acetyl-spermine/spermidine oxidase-like [Engraulis encrasicolus]|uniref:peroxisomal N(1)-acetyl-spermine/spermidine oxidase-like n=1 Tax=Engraulis encrasicolus TaxID=184585 RepID=UPI002FD4FC91